MRWFALTSGAEPERLISPQALPRFQARVRELTSRTRGISIKRMIGSLKPYLLGWRSYFGFSQDPLVLRNLDARIRRRTPHGDLAAVGDGADSIRQLTAIWSAPHASGSGRWLPDWLVGDVATRGCPASAAQCLFRLARPASPISCFERLTPPNCRGTGPVCPVV